MRVSRCTRTINFATMVALLAARGESAYVSTWVSYHVEGDNDEVRGEFGEDERTW